MKNKKNIQVILALLSVVTISAFNVQKGVNLSNDIATFGISNMFTLTDASANIIPPTENYCTNGADCDEANGLKYSTFGVGSGFICCGITAPSSGKKTK